MRSAMTMVRMKATVSPVDCMRGRTIISDTAKNSVAPTKMTPKEASNSRRRGVGEAMTSAEAETSEVSEPDTRALG